MRAVVVVATLIGGACVAPQVFAVPTYKAETTELARRAQLVVEGQVLRVRSGFEPARQRLHTYVTLRVERVWRGDDALAGSELMLREPGGAYGDLVHVVDAVPVYEEGERVLVFLEAARDGALRTVGMYQGKFRITDDARGTPRLDRDLGGSGLFPALRSMTREGERWSRGDLFALVASIPHDDEPPATSRRRGADGDIGKGTRPAQPTPTWRATPPDLDRLRWSDEGSGIQPEFAPLSSSSPTRWDQADTSTAVLFDIERARDPMGNGTASVNEIQRAMAAWSNVPEARVILQAGNDNANFTGVNASSPADAYPPGNIVLFGDPYDDISDPSGCSGTLAIGGYWRSGSANKTINNVTYYPALRGYVIFNRNFECFLGNADNLAEVATHELGHALGIGHSSVADAVMRASAYGSRGPRLGNDDRDAAHCTYPHTLTLGAPNGGESWTSGQVRTISWSASSESGSDPGAVALQYSIDGGSNWLPIASNEPNDGSYSWTVPDNPSNNARLRVVRPNLVSPTPSPYPSACSADPSNSPFTLLGATAGSIPNGSGGSTPLRLTKSGSNVSLTWGSSCSTSATNYAIYEGTLTSIKTGAFDHVSRTCAAGTDLTETIVPGSGGRYYLIAPLASGAEGRLGKTSAGVDRPAAASPCSPRESASCP